MSYSRFSFLLAVFCLVHGAGARGQDSAVPNRVPLTRPEMKQALEDLKQRAPRVPPPELTEEEKLKAGERAASIEGRLRARYLAYEPAMRFSSREPDPKVSLSSDFKTSMFWIVSRLNNCHY